MNKLKFGPITVNSGESLKTREPSSEPSALNSLKAIPVHRSGETHLWSTPTLLISTEVSREGTEGVIYKDVVFHIGCSELSFERSYECKLKLFEGGQLGWVAEMVSIEGKCPNTSPGGDLKIEVTCADMESVTANIPLVVVL